MMTTSTKNRVYISTYAKYNNGSLHGKWFDLDGYQDWDALADDARDFHEDEDDPELMIQDHEGIPSDLVSETEIDDRAFSWIELDEDEQNVVRAYWDNVDCSDDIDSILEKFLGQFDSVTHYAECYVDDSGMLDDLPDVVRRYFDCESFGRDIELSGDIVFIDSCGYAFSNH